MKYLDAASLLLSLLLSTHVAQAALPEDEVAQVVRAEMAKQHIPGLALLVSRKGVPVREEGFGLASLELNVPVKPERGDFKKGAITYAKARRPLIPLSEPASGV